MYHPGRHACILSDFSRTELLVHEKLVRINDGEQRVRRETNWAKLSLTDHRRFCPREVAQTGRPAERPHVSLQNVVNVTG